MARHRDERMLIGLLRTLGRIELDLAYREDLISTWAMTLGFGVDHGSG